MITQEFKLTVRPADLLELYRNDFHYKLFSKPNYPNLAFIGLLLVLIPLSLVAGTYDAGNYFMTLILLCGLGYYTINLLSEYWKIKQRQRTVTDWIRSIEGYQSHRVSVHDGFLKYCRDQETFLYSFREMATMYHTNEHFYCKLNDGMDLVLPEKAFDAGAYRQFTKAVDTMKE